jgi:hypothetical protein
MMIALSDKILRLAYQTLIIYYTNTLLLLLLLLLLFHVTLLRLFSINLNKSSLDVNTSSLVKLKSDERDTFGYTAYGALFLPSL